MFAKTTPQYLLQYQLTRVRKKNEKNEKKKKEKIARRKYKLRYTLNKNDSAVYRF